MIKEVTSYQLVVLFFISFLTFGSFWVFDTPGAIQSQLTEWFGGPKKYTSSMNLLLYSVYAYPNIVLALFGGYILDELLGIRKSTVLFCLLVLLGQLLFALGIQYKMYWLAVFGRFVFGLGGESLSVAQTAYCARWFDPSILTLAMSLIMCVSRIGSTVNFLVTPVLANSGVPLSLWTGVVVCGVSFTSSIILTVLDGAKKFKSQPVNVVVEEKVAANQLLAFPLRAWLLFLLCLFFYVAIVTFYSVASDIMQKTGKFFEPDAASRLLAIPNLVSLVLFPILGWAMDKYGRTLDWLLSSVILLVVGHVLFLMNTMGSIAVHPAWLMVVYGFAYAIGACAMWPMLALIVDIRFLGTGYGLMTAFNNTGSAIFPQIIGKLQDTARIKKWRYNGVEVVYAIPILIFIFCAGLCVIFCVVLLIVDKRSINPINKKRSDSDTLSDLEADDRTSLLWTERNPDASYQSLPTSVYYAPNMPMAAIRIRKQPTRSNAAAALRGNYLSRLGIAHHQTIAQPPINTV